MAECRNVAGIVVADFVAGGADCGHKIRMTSRAVADEKESGLGVVAVQDVEELRRESGMRAIVERKGNERKPRADAVDNVWREPFKRGEQPERLGPESEEGEQHKGADQDQGEE